MKNLIKTISVFTLFALLFCFLLSCGNNNGNNNHDSCDDTTIRIAVLNGTTGFGIAPLNEKIKAGDENEFKAEIDFYADPTMVSPLVISGNVDIAAVPTNLASVLYNKTNGGVKVIALTTGGVLYLLSSQVELSGPSSDIADYTTLESLSGKSVSVPGQGSNPEYVLKAILNKKGLSDSISIDYTYTSPDELASGLSAGKTHFALLPEPKASITANTISSKSSVKTAVQRIDISKEWKEATGTNLVQGCLIVRTEFAEKHTELLNKFIEEYQKTFNEALGKNLAYAVVSSGIIAKRAVLTDDLIERCNLICTTGNDMIEPLNAFFEALYEVSPTSIGGKVPDSNIYYIKK